MKVHHIGLAASALLLTAAQDAPTPPAEGSTFAEAFTEQSNAAKAEQTADELAKPAETTEPSPGPAEAAEAQPEAAEPPAAPADEPNAEATGATEAPLAARPPNTPEPEAEAEAEAEVGPKLTKGDPVTRDFLIGAWAEPGKSCEAAIDFQADGKMIGPFPRWELADGELTMVGNRQKMRLSVVDQDTIQSRRSEADPPRTLKRCPKALPLPKP